jgi:uncharacterized protein (TIGR00266 family)
MPCHKVDYEILGSEMQIVEVELDPGETVVAEAGAMNYMEDGIEFTAKMGDGSEPESGFFSKLANAGKRMLAGESIFLTHFTNHAPVKRRVAFAAPYPGKILALDLAKIGGGLTCQKDSFLCAALGTKIGIAFQKRLGAGFFGGEGFILEKLEGDGMAFIHAGGHVIKKQLKDETLRVDTGCVVAFTRGIEFDIERAGGLKSMVLGGEGMFLTTLRGTGTVLLQSLPFSRLAAEVVAHTGIGGKARDEGSAIGGLSRMFESS